MKKNLKKRSKNHVVHLSHSHAINYHVPSLLFVTPSSTCGTWYGLQVYMQGTQERLGSRSAINETKSSAALVTDCLVSCVQTGVPLQCRSAWPNVYQKYLASAGKGE